jgi:DNA polymerase I-like protein with 3'-5' exonuclease and polymerase domains
MKYVSNGFDVRGRALQDGELAAWLSEHSLGNRFSLAVAGPDLAGGGAVKALAIVAADGEGRSIDVAALTADDEAALASWLADPGPPKAGHDAKTAMHALAARGWTLRGVTSDTVLAAHLLRPEATDLGLNDLLIHHMRCALPAEAVELQEYSSQALILRACAVLDLADVLDEELARTDSSSLLSRMELPVQRVLTEMECAGIAVDRALLTRLRESRAMVDDLLNSIAPDGRIHTTFDQTGAATGRISSSRPNLRDLPLHADGGPRVRDAFVAGDGYAELMTARYDRLEPRIVAHLSGDEGLIAAGGVDSYHLATVLTEARNLGYAVTLLGRRHYLPELHSGERQVREAAERAALEMAVQGSAADIVNAAMIDVDRAIKDAALRSRIVLQAADELVFEVADGERDTLAACVRELADGHPLDVPIEVSIRHGRSWGAAVQLASRE